MTRARETADVVNSKNQCTAWCVFNGSTTGTNPPIDGFNVASITRTAEGRYTINFETAMDNSNYALIALPSGNNRMAILSTPALSSAQMAVRHPIADVDADSNLIAVVVFGGKD